MLDLMDFAKPVSDFAIHETEVFFLLGKLADADPSQSTTLLQNLTQKHSVKAAIKGNPPDSLEIYGPEEDVEKFKKAWDEVKAVSRLSGLHRIRLIEYARK